MMRDACLHSRRCWINGRLTDATVVVEGGIIKELHEGVYDGGVSIYRDFGDLVLMPGVIDAHVHVNDPGRDHWEGFETATKAAALGGSTTIVDMPLNSVPVTATAEALEEKLNAALGSLNVHCGFWAGAIGQKRQTLKNALEAGCLGVKAFLIDSGIPEFPAIGRRTLDKIMPMLAELERPLLVHAEIAIPDDVYIAPSEDSTRYKTWLKARPKSWENAAVRLMIELCGKYQCRTHIVHLSSAEVLPDIRRARDGGWPLTVETCAHYLLFDAEDIPDVDPRFKCAPPIRERSNNDQLRAAVQEGLIDFITTDHSPAPPEIKALDTGNLLDAWGGIAGIQFLLPAAWTALRDLIPLEEFIPLLTSEPASFIGMDNKGSISVGSDADLVAWAPEEYFTPTTQSLVFRHKISPYTEMPLQGVVYHTFVKGCHIVDDGAFVLGGCGDTILG